ncbi:DnaB-like helicase C-terminal domain-containing protein [Neomoorella mulderi]|uniref:Replicative DNA helicase n=1 Tax=Moorella mulderi DSM 14980 TaxID=1122241 RepID=A0A151B060_9FIRM|nr:DnaB-like helicase C-terminal domain-containing protein [Moorella mulderi]KYH33305.1 replicative DNA helicase [Moorella mulderi DSM 14980]
MSSKSIFPAEVFVDTALEAQVLSAMAKDADAYWRYAEDFLVPDAFSDSGHRAVFLALADYHSGRGPLPELPAAEPPADPADLDSAVRQLVTLAQKRRAAEVVGRFWQDLAQGGAVQDVLAAAIEKLSEAQQAVRELSPGQTKTLTELLGDMETRYLEEYKLLQMTGRPTLHPSFGKELPTFTELTGGFAPGVWVIGGQPNVGKTFLALTWLHRYVVAEKDTASLWVDVQETRPLDKLALYLACIHAEKCPLLYERRKANPQEISEICRKTAAEFKDRVEIMEATSNTTVAHIRGAVRRLLARTGAKRCMVILDYLQKFGLMGGGGNLTDTRARINHALSTMTEITKICNGPVVLISSLGKDAYRRKTEDASIADFKDSGEVEYQGDVGIILRWGKDERNEQKECAVKVIDAWIVKSRLGPSAVVRLYSVRTESKYVEADPGFIPMPLELGRCSVEDEEPLL